MADEQVLERCGGVDYAQAVVASELEQGIGATEQSLQTIRGGGHDEVVAAPPRMV